MSKKELDKDKDLTNKYAPDEHVTVEEETHEEEKKHGSKFLRKLKYGSMFYIVIALVVAIVVVLNIMVGFIGKRSPIL